MEGFFYSVSFLNLNILFNIFNKYLDESFAVVNKVLSMAYSLRVPFAFFGERKNISKSSRNLVGLSMLAM